MVSQEKSSRNKIGAVPTWVLRPPPLLQTLATKRLRSGEGRRGCREGPEGWRAAGGKDGPSGKQADIWAGTYTDTEILPQDNSELRQVQGHQQGRPQLHGLRCTSQAFLQPVTVLTLLLLHTVQYIQVMAAPS